MLSSTSLHPLAPTSKRNFIGHGAIVRAGPSGKENPPSSSSSLPQLQVHRRAIHLAAASALFLWSTPVEAGVLSGFSGLESVPGPELPKIDFLNRWNEERRKKYEDLDSKFQSSPVLKELLEKSKQNKERNKRAIEDKYCLRGAEWGIGDCSTDGMTQEEKEAFIEELKKRTAAE